MTSLLSLFRINYPSIGMRNTYQFRFFPVGQGLFSAGQLRPAGIPPFVWTYDCGTTSARTLLASSVADFDSWHRGPLGLVALSHFDRDHVNGICDLMQGRRVDVMLLPYVGFAERILLALNVGIEPDDPFLDFFVNPTAYFMDRGLDVQRFLFVSSAGDSAASVERVPEDFRREAFGDYLTYEPDPEPPGGDPVEPVAGAAGGQVGWLRPGGTIRYRDLWEFVPYNDAVSRRRPLSLQVVANFVLCRDEESLARLRRAYDRAFGKGSHARNAISLFLYAGPVTPGRSQVLSKYPATLITDRVEDCRTLHHESMGWLATGDGYLDTPERLDRLLAYLGPARTARINVLQVMHHGSRRNWHPGLAAKIKPSVSIFSSDPGHLGFRHPHPPVMTDFGPYGPCQVDRVSGCWIVGKLPVWPSVM